jgi:hypothetical protein
MLGQRHALALMCTHHLVRAAFGSRQKIGRVDTEGACYPVQGGDRDGGLAGLQLAEEGLAHARGGGQLDAGDTSLLAVEADAAPDERTQFLTLALRRDRSNRAARAATDPRWTTPIPRC